MTTKKCSVPSCSNTVDVRSFECDEHFGFTTIGPGTVKRSDLPSHLPAELRLRLEESLMADAGGDPDLAARRAESPEARVRLLSVDEEIRKPACTVEVGGRHFEITNAHSRRPASRFFADARRSLEDDLPHDGWSENPIRPAVPTLAERGAAQKKEYDQLEDLLVGFGLGTHEEFTEVRSAYEPLSYPQVEAAYFDLLGDISRNAESVDDH